MEGLDNFQLVDNRPNQALIYANLGRLMFSCAKAHYHDNASSPIGAEGTDRPTGEVFTKERETPRQEFSLKERLYYNKAAEYYIMGKQVCCSYVCCIVIGNVYVNFFVLKCFNMHVIVFVTL